MGAKPSGKTTHRKLPEIPLAVTYSKSTENLYEGIDGPVGTKRQFGKTSRSPASSSSVYVKSTRSQSIPECNISILVTQDSLLHQSTGGSPSQEKPNKAIDSEKPMVGNGLPIDKPNMDLDMERSLPAQLSPAPNGNHPSNRTSLEQSLPTRYLKLYSPLRESMFKRSSAMELIMPSHLMSRSPTEEILTASMSAKQAFDPEKPTNDSMVNGVADKNPTLSSARSVPSHLDTISLEGKEDDEEQSLPHYTLPHKKSNLSDSDLLASKPSIPRVESRTSPSVTDHYSLISDSDSENSSISSIHDERSRRFSSPRPLSHHSRSSPTNERSSYLRAVTSSQQISPKLKSKEVENETETLSQFDRKKVRKSVF